MRAPEKSQLETEVKITIVTPVFNGALHIESCVKNVAAQGCAAAEHLVVDGASADATVDILKRLEPAFPRMRWISERDSGQSDAMNKGRRLARGEIIGVLNADDYYEPGALNRALALLQQSQTPSLIVGACNVREPSGRVRYVNRPRHLSLKAFLSGYEHPVNPSAYFYHAAVHDRADGFDPKDHFSMDVDFLYRAVDCADVVYVDEIWGNFIEWPGSKTILDKAAERASGRIKEIKKRYWRRLSLSGRVHVACVRPFVVIARKIRNTMERKEETALRYRAKLRKISAKIRGRILRW